jgi:hypothetical protein
VRLLEQLHGLFACNPGQDLLQLILHDRAGNCIELVGARISIGYSPEVDAQLRTLVGDEHVVLLTSGQPSEARAL